ncbi:MAG: hypothetical protein KJZ62_12830, partial [Fimbriimonadaceae bacterium]|nr:hypothetical protein [Fimbriimonadaceae bacterium]
SPNKGGAMKVSNNFAAFQTPGAGCPGLTRRADRDAHANPDLDSHQGDRAQAPLAAASLAP